MAYGLPGTPTNQHTREYGTLIASSTLITGQGEEDMLPAPGAGSHYRIWGIVMSTKNACVGYVESVEDQADILTGACKMEGPLVVMFPVPIHMADNIGLQFRTIAGSVDVCIATVYYTVWATPA